MAFRSSQDARVYIGQLAAAAYARSVSSPTSTATHDISTLADRSRQFVTGQSTSTFSIAGPLDTDASADAQYDAITSLQAATTTATPITYLPLGTDGAAWLAEAWETSIDTMSAHDSSVDWAMTAQTTGPADLNGVVLENNTTVTTDTDGTANNNGAGTTNGAVFHLHVTAYSGLTSDAIIVEGSTTGSFGGEETTIASFASVTGLTSERVVVTGTVPRYLRVVDDVTGTGSITRFVAVSRR